MSEEIRISPATLADLIIGVARAAREGQTYILTPAEGTPRAITHLVCGRTSFNHGDVLELYCGHCHVFLGR